MKNNTFGALIVIFMVSSVVFVGLAASTGRPDELSEASDLLCYEDEGEPVKPEFELHNVSATVHWFDTVAELHEATGRPEAEALSSCEQYETADIAFCEIWVVRPRRVVGDPQMDSLGHEILHGLMGDFHE